MSEYYVMTNWGPMKASNKGSGSVTSLTKGAPADMDTFLEVATKINELESRLNNMGIASKGSWLVKEVSSLPDPSGATINTIYSVKDKGSYATVNTGTEESPKYEWVSIGTSTEETDPVWTKAKDDYYTKKEIDAKNYLTEHQDISGKQDIIKDLEEIRKGAALGKTALQEETYKGTVTSVNNITPDANGNVTIEISSEVTEETVASWGFTKNTGTYTKPENGIPKTDLVEEIQEALKKADSALQSYAESDPLFTASAASKITETDITNWNSKSTFSGSYNDLKDKPTIPSIDGLETSKHAEDTYVKKSEYEAKIKELTTQIEALITRVTALEGGTPVTKALGYYAVAAGSNTTERKASAKALTESDFIELTETYQEINIVDPGMIVVLTASDQVPTVMTWNDAINAWNDNQTYKAGVASVGGSTKVINGLTYNLWYCVTCVSIGNTPTKITIN